MNIIWIFFGLGLLGLDMLSKYLAQTALQEPFIILPGILEFSESLNPGIAFSLPVPNIAMLIITPLLLAAVVFGARKYCNMRSGAAKIALALFLAGGMGNYINRAAQGAVVDFIDFSFWPSFNLADAYLTISAFLLIIFHGKIISNDERH